MRLLMIFRFFLGAFLFCFVPMGRAQSKIEFQSIKPWQTARWYLIGQVDSSQITWLNGKKTKLKAKSSQNCNESSSKVEFAKLSKSNHEVLVNSMGWIAVSVDPNQSKDSLALRYDSGCEREAALEWSFGALPKAEAALTPYLFFKPQSNTYMGQEFSITVPKASSSTDIILELLAGAWVWSLGNAESSANKNLYSFPLMEARGEWNPPKLRGLGFELKLLQGLFSFGGISGQSLLVSEWNAGLYYQVTLPVSQGLIVRGHLNYFQHLVDGGTDVVSVAAFEANHHNILASVSLAQYFAKRWSVQLRADYGIPSKISGAEVSQSYLKTNLYVGYMITDVVTLLLEGAYRVYSYEGQSSTSAISAMSGFRLEL